MDKRIKVLILALNYKVLDWLYTTAAEENEAYSWHPRLEVTLYGPGYPNFKFSDVQDIIKQVYGESNKPDVVFNRMVHCPAIVYQGENKLAEETLARSFPSGINKLSSSILKIDWFNDFWQSPVWIRNRLIRDNVDVVLLSYYFKNREPKELHWAIHGGKVNPKHVCDVALNWPRTVGVDVFSPRLNSQVADIDVSMIGQVEKNLYPFRPFAKKVLSRKKSVNFFYKAHPGYKPVSTNEAIVRESYADVLRRSLMFVVDGGRYRLPYIKYFEAMASATCMIGTEPIECWEILRLKHGHNALFCTEDTFESTIDGWLPKREELIKIGKRAYETFTRYHHPTVRAEHFYQMLISFLEGDGSWNIYDAVSKLD